MLEITQKLFSEEVLKFFGSVALRQLQWTL